ncbi:hypothetical protein K503DRAFT_710268 [Rhizopogon vinicolor AM-OR11-026]|uniref:WW domain-containing protein n=1 Tax=Rhizopogon vinicolor AM-OR11-026 TaxID=1314800 RepID=A0A1B7NCM2_9AGAM|nr:hypothetical protein K503DRAFT_710268 [Rhizopogon vinicolor AM-OR11-026]
MMPVHFLNILKKLLSRLASRSASLLFFFLSLFRRFTIGRTKFEDITWTRFPGGALLQSQGDIAGENVPICSSLLPPGQMGMEVVGDPPSPSDDPYLRIHSRCSRPSSRGTAMPWSETGSSTTEEYMSAADIDSSLEGRQEYRGTRPVDLHSDPHFHPIAPPGSNLQLATDDIILYDGPPICGMVAEEVKLYKMYIPRESGPSRPVVPAMTFNFSVHDMIVPPGWITLVHPEGFRYFVNQEKRTFTQMNICDKDICEDIEYYMQYLLDELQAEIGHRILDLDRDQVDLVLEPRNFGDNSVVCCYYFANHRDRCLFWLNEYDTEGILTDCQGVESLSHIRLAVQAQYWKHCEYFPCMWPITQDLVDEVKDMLIYATCDHLTSLQSTAPLDVITLKDYLSIVDRIKVSPLDQSMQQYHASIVIGRIMYAFSRSHFINFHGEKCVRLFFEQTVHPYAPSLLMVVLAPFLFFDPMTLIRELHTAFVDNMPSSERWKTFTLKWNGQLRESNLLATVLLNANVGFLAINSVDVGGRSPTQLASYMSLVASLGSITLGLLFVSHNSTIGEGTALQAAVSLSGVDNKIAGLEKLAIIYSLPKVLLMWGMVFFFAAFSINWWSPGDDTSRAIVGSVILVVLVMISFSIVRNRHRGDSLPQQVTEFMGMRRVEQRVTSRPARMTPEGAPAGHSQVNREMDASMRTASHLTGFQPERPGSDVHENPSNSFIPETQQPDTSVDLPLPLHESDSMLTPSDSRTNPGFLSIPDDNRNPVDMHFTTSPYSTSERGMMGMPAMVSDSAEQTEAVAIDTGLSSGGLEHPQSSSSLMPPPRIFTKRANGRYKMVVR